MFDSRRDDTRHVRCGTLCLSSSLKRPKSLARGPQMINFSELLWHPGRPKSQRFGTFVVDERSKIEHSSLQRIPTERAQVEPGSRLALMGDPLSVGADRFRYLRMRLMELRELAKLRSVMITSPLPADGKSTIATCLATSLSEGGRYSTLLVDSDLHHPSITRTLRLRPQAGVAECVEDGLDPMSVVRKIDPFGWFLLQAGEPKGNPTELLQSAAFSAMMQNLHLISIGFWWTAPRRFR